MTISLLLFVNELVDVYNYWIIFVIWYRREHSSILLRMIASKECVKDDLDRVLWLIFTASICKSFIMITLMIVKPIRPPTVKHLQQKFTFSNTQLGKLYNINTAFIVAREFTDNGLYRTLNNVHSHGHFSLLYKR